MNISGHRDTKAEKSIRLLLGSAAVLCRTLCGPSGPAAVACELVWARAGSWDGEGRSRLPAPAAPRDCSLLRRCDGPGGAATAVTGHTRVSARDPSSPSRHPGARRRRPRPRPRGRRFGGGAPPPWTPSRARPLAAAGPCYVVFDDFSRVM